MGTPDFAVASLVALAAAGHEIAAVYSQPPRPAGRGHRVHPSPVQAHAEKNGWLVRTPRSLRDPAEQEAFAELGLDAAVVAAYGLILPPEILSAPAHGCLNVHASLLPRWRGAAPIQRALLAGDEVTGVSIMQMDAGLDTGPVLVTGEAAIARDETGGSLHDKLAVLGGRLIVEVLQAIAAGTAPAARTQPETGVLYAEKIDKAETRLDWRQPAVALERQIRAFAPWPGTWSEIVRAGGEDVPPSRLKIQSASLVPDLTGRDLGAPGEVLDDTLTIACGQGALRLTSVQRPGKAVMDSAAFLRGTPLGAGDRLA